MDVSGLFVPLLAGFLAGSIPTAYLIVKAVSGDDLRVKGSSNIGAYNAASVTGSRGIGILVGLLDAVKGIAAWLLGILLAPADIALVLSCGTSLIGAVAGHNYNLWLSLSSSRIEGGKGLATAAGGLLFLMPKLLIIWAGLFLLGRWFFSLWRNVNDVIPGNVFATLMAPIPAYYLYGPDGALITAFLALLVLPRHYRQLRALLKPRVVRVAEREV